MTDKKGFDYLIREAKYKDHIEGDLDAAIDLMEKAYDKIKANPLLPCTDGLNRTWVIFTVMPTATTIRINVTSMHWPKTRTITMP